MTQLCYDLYDLENQDKKTQILPRPLTLLLQSVMARKGEESVLLLAEPVEKERAKYVPCMI